jgi:predicted Zn finger-like uncharacterized protein
MSAVRLRRLHADYQRLQDFVKRHPRVQLIQSDGNPPERYQVQYEIRSLRQKDGRLVVVDNHLVEITLPLNYPRLPPQCRMLTPIFHPNIAPHAICIGDHWSPGETLSSIVARIGELIAYQSYNVKSPLNGEAARWTSENLDRLPLDPVSMLVEETGVTQGAEASSRERSTAPPSPPPPRRAAADTPSTDAPTPATPKTTDSVPSPRARASVSPAPEQNASAVAFACPECGSALRVPLDLAGKRARCPRCKGVITVPVKESSS